MPAEALAVMSELLTADGALEASSGRPAAHSEGRELATQAESVRTSCGLGRHGGGRRCSGDPKTGSDAPKTENCEPKTENQGQLDESKEGRLLCAVCAEPLADEEEEEQEVRRLGWCGHMFHRACIDPWLLFHSASCPLCRRAPEL